MYSLCRKQIRVIQRLLAKAFRHSRSGETRLLIQKTLFKLHSWSGMEEPTFKSNLPHETVKPTVNGTKVEVCPEHYGSAKEGHIDFENVYKKESCDRIPLEQLVEILAYSDSCTQAQHLVKRIRAIYPTLSIQMAMHSGPSDLGSEICLKQLPLVRFHYGKKDVGATWIELAKTGNTKYILVGRNIVEFTHYTDLDRMLRVLHSLHVDIVGGAVRLEPEGRWYAGCYQTNIRNFTIRIQPGHDMSAQSCAYCDYIASPFLIRRELFQEYLVTSDSMYGLIPFVDLFLQFTTQYSGQPTIQTVACIDILFHVAGHNTWRGYGLAETGRGAWKPLARKWSVDHLILPGSVEHKWPCSQVDIQCGYFKSRGMASPGCCLEDLAYCLKVFLKLASKYNLSTFPAEGSNLGAVKTYGGILPWERDADIYWDVYGFQTVSGPIARELAAYPTCNLGSVEYNTIYREDIKRCSVFMKHCLSYTMHSSYWHLELYGLPWMISENLHGLANPTQVYIDGLWTRAMPNPGKAARNRYGDNVLGHIEHWMDYGKATSWTNYTNVEVAPFLPCPTGAVPHSCLQENFLPYGNIQFQDVPV
ncbi:hypothetical protein PHET_10798 [Paragonimus heterotremus]|uniref:Uncharacterized protein n=1 Tax=Paragonimus heterotremus TaxID=100268 RepID=A0A8J4SIS3_9TREM|nr:hypothetical protein PHET_10798 [Paragonimus heterotremus]